MRSITFNNKPIETDWTASLIVETVEKKYIGKKQNTFKAALQYFEQIFYEMNK